MRRRYAAATLAATLVGALLMAGPSPTLGREPLVGVTGTENGQTVAAAAATRFQAKGVASRVDQLDVYALEDGSLLVAPRRSRVLDVDISFDAVTGEETFSATVLPPPDDALPSAALSAVEQSEVGTLAAPYWSLVGSYCWSRSWYASGTVWMDTCYHKHKMINDGSGTVDYFELHMFATGASVKPHKLKDLNIWAGPASGSPAQSWHDWYPKSDMSGGNCGQITVGITAPPVGIGYTHNWCDKWDMTKSTIGGNYRNIYVAPLFFEPIQTEREVAFVFATKVAQGQTASWVFSWVARRT